MFKNININIGEHEHRPFKQGSPPNPLPSGASEAMPAHPLPAITGHEILARDEADQLLVVRQGVALAGRRQLGDANKFCYFFCICVHPVLQKSLTGYILGIVFA